MATHLQQLIKYRCLTYSLTALSLLTIASLKILPQASMLANAATITANGSSLKTYPISVSTPISEIYSITVNGNPIAVERYNSTSYVRFGFQGSADIQISLNQPIQQYTLSPKSALLNATQTGNQIRFQLDRPKTIMLHKVNGQTEKLVIFAEAIEKQTFNPAAGNVINVLDKGVDPSGAVDATSQIQQAINELSGTQGTLYFPAGVYKVHQLDLRSNMNIYFAAGARLDATKDKNPSYGAGLLNFENVQNITLSGPGMVHGQGSYWRPRGGWYSLVRLANADNINIRDVLLLDSAVANIVIEYSDGVRIENAKIIADPQPAFLNTDGVVFWSSRNINVNRLFYQGTDDATSHGGSRTGRILNNENINVTNSVLYTGGAFKIGTTLEQDWIRNVTYENIDVIRADELSGLWPVTGANFENIFFKNIRVEEITNPSHEFASSSLFQWRITTADWEPNSSEERLGYIRNIYLQNVTVDNPGSATSKFQGYDNERDLNRIRFDNFSVNGKVITNSAEARFEKLPSTKDQQTYVNLQFSQSDPNIVTVESDLPDATEFGISSRFLIRRTGDLSQPLTVSYRLRGTATVNQDYIDIGQQAVIPAWSDSVSVWVQPIADGVSEPPEHVVLELQNQPHSLSYLVGKQFQATIQIRDF